MLLAIGLLVLAPAIAKAGSVTFEFTGFTTGFTISGPARPVPDIPFGTPIFGSFSFDTLAPPIAAGGGTAFFPLTRFTLEVPAVPEYSFSVGVTDNPFANQARLKEGEMLFSANTETNSHLGYFRVAAPYCATANEMWANLLGGSGNLLSASFTRAAGPSTFGTATFQATSLTQSVPEPTTTTLFAASIAGLLACHRRRALPLAA